MSGQWRTQSQRVGSEQQEEARRPSLAFVMRLVLVLILVVAFLLVFKRSTRLEPKLQAVLDAEQAALTAGDWQAFAALLDPDHSPFRQQQKALFDSAMSARRRGESYPGIPYPLYVTEAGRRDDLAWARVSGETVAGGSFHRVEFFRRVYGDWLHTGPDPAWWGPEQVQQTAHVVWRYRQQEEAWIADMAPRMETVHARTCADLGLDPSRSVVTFELCYSLDCTYLLFYPAGPTIELPAPLLVGWLPETASEWLPGVLVGHLLVRATDSRPEPGALLGNDSVLMEGIRLWETEQVTGEPITEAWLADLALALAAGRCLSFDQMAFPTEPDTYSLLYAQSYALVDYLVATQGRDVLPALARASSASNTLREALVQVLGPEVDLTAFEAGWMTWMQGRYGE